MNWWNIHYRDREYAKEVGDPVLATVCAESKEEAEAIATRQGIGGVFGVWAVKERN